MYFDTLSRRAKTRASRRRRRGFICFSSAQLPHCQARGEILGLGNRSLCRSVCRRSRPRLGTSRLWQISNDSWRFQWRSLFLAVSPDTLIAEEIGRLRRVLRTGDRGDPQAGLHDPCRRHDCCCARRIGRPALAAMPRRKYAVGDFNLAEQRSRSGRHAGNHHRHQFLRATAVRFGGNAAGSFTVNSATPITATSPAGNRYP